MIFPENGLNHHHALFSEISEKYLEEFSKIRQG